MLAATLAGLIVLGLRCRHQLHAEAAGFALQACEVALLAALLKFHGAAVDPNLPLLSPADSISRPRRGPSP